MKRIDRRRSTLPWIGAVLVTGTLLAPVPAQAPRSRKPVIPSRLAHGPNAGSRTHGLNRVEVAVQRLANDVR